MPPRIPTLPGVGTFNLCLRPAITKPASAPLLPLTQTASLTKWEKKRLAKRDPYRWAQIQQRKNANVERQAELQQVRDGKWGHPVWGIPTPFVESFDSAGQEPLSRVAKDEEGNPLEEARPLPTSPHILNHLLTRDELEEAIAHAYTLTKPVFDAGEVDEKARAEAQQKHELNHARAVEALRRIVSMDNASSKMRKHANIRRCVEEFGRHNTDKVLTPKPKSIHPNETPMPDRVGPDTGSSEVQIAILSVKIRKLAQELEKNRGYKDKHNKRNLRVLCHRRQKLLQYMERKERGSERWTHMLEKLGLSPATWKEQISF
ncbi:related to ribosomal protein S15 precursor (mitochondrial) [Cephalotrichum gorgonifer]|uniref:Related to ribosomal protein S15 (Mitochondrial) n=1 Tax=Cephalotrichum gorgonifer TaxID=2041049 RepID=A0AAE8N1R3_9PEZI|nr:related to ribosomal protein S15 precursor (mitochondrial) [Cephalotrichum gorgonifer]